MKKNNVFNNKIEQYEKWFKTNKNLLDAELETIRQMLPASGEGIEIGVGTGIFATNLGIEHGVEPSEKMGAKAAKKGIHVINAFAEELPIEDESYQFALMVTVDCFLEDVAKAFKEIWRILVKDGYFIIAFIDKTTSLGIIYEQHKHSDSFYKYANFHSSEEIIILLKKAGFEILEKKQTIFTLENKVQEIKDGVGEGVFAVIKAKKC
ncbi:MAG: class I SAM-dependent methyltransferase [Candidatus Humimicrobiaceae bacterium]